jgi:hypothetical protein
MRTGGSEHLMAKSTSYEHLCALLESEGAQIQYTGEGKKWTPQNKMQNRFFHQNPNKFCI